MSDAIIHPRREKTDPCLPKTGLLVLNPADMGTVNTLSRAEGLHRHFLFNAQLFADDHVFLAGPAVGAPMAALVLEKLIALGARRILVYGWCGSIHPQLRSKTLFMPNSGVSEEGTSSHYRADNKTDLSLQSILQSALLHAGMAVMDGPVWTTDALYRETREKITHYSSQGVLAVDMEYTGLQAVANFRGICLGTVMLVSDELFSDQWAPVYGQKQFRVLSRETLNLLFSFLQRGILQ